MKHIFVFWKDVLIRLCVIYNNKNIYLEICSNIHCVAESLKKENIYKNSERTSHIQKEAIENYVEKYREKIA